jgi:hypothetical protein
MAGVHIEPTTYDAVVVSSGLPQVLIARCGGAAAGGRMGVRGARACTRMHLHARARRALLRRAQRRAPASPLPSSSHRHSALARAGKSVLLLDAADWYGGPWASLTGPAFSDLLRDAQHQQPGGRSSQAGPQPGGSSGADGNSSDAELLPPGCELRRLAQAPSPALGGVRVRAPGDGPAFPRTCIVDLEPKVGRGLPGAWEKQGCGRLRPPAYQPGGRGAERAASSNRPPPPPPRMAPGDVPGGGAGGRAGGVQD